MNADEIIEVVSGWKAGNRIQMRPASGEGSWKTMEKTPAWDFSTWEYRTMPVPVPPGDLTWEEAKRLKTEGVAIDYIGPAGLRNGADWSRVIFWLDDPLCDDVPHSAYRRTPPKPEPRMVALGPEDVKRGDLIRHKQWAVEDGHKWVSVIGCGPRGVLCCTFIGDDPMVRLVSWDVLQGEDEISRDGGLTWARAEKEAQ